MEFESFMEVKKECTPIITNNDFEIFFNNFELTEKTIQQKEE